MDLLAKMGAEIWVERGAGAKAGFPDSDFEAKGAKWAASSQEVCERAQVIFCVRVPLSGFSPAHTVIGFCDPLSEPRQMAEFAKTGAALFSMELVPRITRAQS